MRIGDVAKQANIATSAIRYYERAGVLPKARRVNGIRHYDDDVLERLGMIKLSQSAGLSLSETKTLLRAMDQKANAATQLQRLANKKLPELRAALARAETLVELMEAAKSCRCPTLERCAAIARKRGLVP